MQTISRYGFHICSLIVPLMAVGAVGYSLYVQGAASPFLGIAIGIWALFFSLKSVLFIIRKVDDVIDFCRSLKPAVSRWWIDFRPKLRLPRAANLSDGRAEPA